MRGASGTSVLGNRGSHAVTSRSKLCRCHSRVNWRDRALGGFNLSRRPADDAPVVDLEPFTVRCVDIDSAAAGSCRAGIATGKVIMVRYLVRRTGMLSHDRKPAGEHSRESGFDLRRRSPDNFSMPIYEFHCQGCGKDNEILTRSTDWSGTQCPDCGSEKLEKKLSVFAAGASKSSSGNMPAPPACSGDPGNCGMCCGLS